MVDVGKTEFGKLLDSANELVRNLESRKIRIPGGCSLLQSLDCLKQMVDAHEGKTEIPQDKLRMVLRNGIGLAYLSFMLNKCLENNLISNIEPHLSKLVKDQPLFHYNYPRGFGRDSVFELLVAAGFAPKVKDLSMSQSNTGEADLKFNFGGDEWCAECKILYEELSPESDLQNKIQRKLKKGIEQIEATKRKGVILLGLTQRINHDEAFQVNGNQLGSFKSVDAAVGWYKNDLRRVMTEIGIASMTDTTAIELVNFMKDKGFTRTKAIVGFFHSICGVPLETRIWTPRTFYMPTTMAMAVFTTLAENERDAISLAESLNDSFQRAIC